MNQIDEDNVQNVKCNQNNTTGKQKTNLKAKESSETINEINVNKQVEKLSDSLANTIHINNINSNLSNGTTVHTHDEVNSLFNIESNNMTHKTEQDILENDVNNVKVCEDGRDQEIDEIEMVRNFVEGALENLQTALTLKDGNQEEIEIVSYESELQMPEIMRLIQKDLSEPYSIYTYRYFIHNWPKLCFLARHEDKCIGAIVCKLDLHRNVVKRGYIAMLAVDEKYRKRKIGSRLVRKAIQVN